MWWTRRHCSSVLSVHWSAVVWMIPWLWFPWASSFPLLLNTSCYTELFLFIFMMRVKGLKGESENSASHLLGGLSMVWLSFHTLLLTCQHKPLALMFQCQIHRSVTTHSHKVLMSKEESCRQDLGKDTVWRVSESPSKWNTDRIFHLRLSLKIWTKTRLNMHRHTHTHTHIARLRQVFFPRYSSNTLYIYLMLYF